jgi:MerR family transcriptional regulator, copper efflux regulator
MLIGELSKQTGLSKDTIRFYEKLGLITASNHDMGTKSYKKYSLETITYGRLRQRTFIDDRSR